MMISSGAFYYKLLHSADQEMHNVKGVSIYEVENEPISKSGLNCLQAGWNICKMPTHVGTHVIWQGVGEDEV